MSFSFFELAATFATVTANAPILSNFVGNPAGIVTITMSMRILSVTSTARMSFTNPRMSKAVFICSRDLVRLEEPGVEFAVKEAKSRN